MKNNNKVYLKDIAKEAGVSSALVSYVLNGKHKGRINDQTAEKIKKIAKDLNYVPDFFGKGLMSKKTETIGLIIPDLTHPFFTRFARVIENELSKRGYMLLIGSADENLEKQRFLINTFLQKRVDGIILLPLNESENDLKLLLGDTVPYIFTDRYFLDSKYNFIATDNYYGTFSLAASLIQEGKRNLCLITIKSDMHHFKMRKKGFVDACSESSLGVTYEIFELTFIDFKSQLKDILEKSLNKIDAFVFATDFLTMHGANYILKSGLQVPNQVAVAGFDEDEYYSIFPFTIKYYKQPIKKIGKKLVQFILKESSENKLVQEFVKGTIKTN